jgi:stage V sporulation protein AB
MVIIKYIMVILLGFGAGVVIAGAVFAFISVVGVVPRLADKTGTGSYVKWYEEAIIAGGIVGCVLMNVNLYIPIGKVAVAVLGLLIGMFYGCLAVSLAEVLNVVPVIARRTRVRQGIKWFIAAIALGKLVGSVLYYFVPGFYLL